MVLVENVQWETFGGYFWRKCHILEPPAFQKNHIFGLGSTLYLFLSVSVCLCLFIGQYHQMISCQKIYGLCGLEHHSVKINGDVTMRDKQQPSEDRDTQLMDTEC